MNGLRLGFVRLLGFESRFALLILATSPAAADITFKESSSTHGDSGREGACENGPLGLLFPEVVKPPSPLRVDSIEFT